ncbi:MAG TPA: ATPase domain-containing protein [Dongiaceae bacterium]|nr:ATPase domain-containing protein [Dongiaceae bacterium]
MATLASTRFPLVSNDFGRGLEGFRHRIPAELQSTGITELDALLQGGFPRGSVIELCGSSSSGRTSVSFSLLAQATARQETCAFVDVSDCLDPFSLAAAGVDLTRVLWVRCGNPETMGAEKKPVAPSKAEAKPPHGKAREKASGAAGWQHPRESIRGLENAIPSVIGKMERNKTYSQIVKQKAPSPSREELHTTPKATESFMTDRPFTRRPLGKNKPWKKLEQALKVTDLLLHAGGWGVVVIDFGNISWVDARRIELSTWFRFRRAIENTPTILLLLGEDSCAKSCSSVVLRCERKSENWSSAYEERCPAELPMFQGFEMEGRILSSRIGLPPMDSAQWIAKSLWSNSF